jgi:glycosyltransferase involved in cell wall biosynthesis
VKKPDPLQTAILHYTAPPVVGGVESVILAHAQAMVAAQWPVTVIAGAGRDDALPSGASLLLIPEMDSQNQRARTISSRLEQGEVPIIFQGSSDRLATALAPHLRRFDRVIVHNLFTKHFNLPLTAALFRLLDQGVIRGCVAWCHDLTWASPSSRSKVHPGYPWDLLRTYRADVTYVAISRRRQDALADLLGCPKERIRVVYNGVSTQDLLGLSQNGLALADRMGLLDSALNLLMPVRVTRAKNIEYAMDTLARLKSMGCRARLLVTGPPDPHDQASMDYFRSLLELRLQLGLQEEMRFVFNSGPDSGQPFFIDPQLVGELYRLSDLMFMPSHREGFGMPVLEAGLAGIPVVCTNVPAAQEIGSSNVMLFDAAQDPDKLAARIAKWAERDRVHRLKRRVRQRYTWKAIFRRDIEPLLRDEEGCGDGQP